MSNDGSGATLTAGGKEIPLPLVKATEGNNGYDVAKLLKETGNVTLDTGEIQLAGADLIVFAATTIELDIGEIVISGVDLGVSVVSGAAARRRSKGYWQEPIRLGSEPNPYPTLEEYYEQRRAKPEPPAEESAPVVPVDEPAPVVATVATKPADLPPERLEAMVDALAPPTVNQPAPIKVDKAPAAKAAKVADDEEAILWLLLAA